jgi:hypothetical protein
MCADALKDVTQILEGIDAQSLARARNAGQDGCRPPTFIASQEGPVLSSHCDAAQASLGTVIVDFQMAILRVEASPLSKREIIRRLGTSAAQFYRLLDPTNYRKSPGQLLSLLYILDCEVDLVVRARKTA